jgi:hypothetical protein
MKKILTMVSGVAICVLFSGISALCQDAAPAAAMESPKVAGHTQVAAEHPLVPVIRWAEKERPNIATVKDYTAIMQKQENIKGEVQGAQVMEVKVRHQPFSVYTKFRFPQDLNGQQAIYVKGKNNDKLLAHGVGLQKKLGTLTLDPEGPIAMMNQKYPITEMGVLNLVDKLLEVGRKDAKFGECNVTYTEGVKIGSGDAARECTMIEVMHPVPRQNFIFYVARIYVDKELNLPIRYESYDWPRREGETPKLLEAYTYLNLKINVGLTDTDFDPANPVYAFP